MRFRDKIFNSLPSFIKTPVRNLYYTLRPYRTSPERIDKQLIQNLFDSRDEYERYEAELHSTEFSRMRDNFFTELEQIKDDYDRQSLGTVNSDMAEKYYCMVRKCKPSLVVETGVGYGFSTLHILYALSINENRDGMLYSIDKPHYIDEESNISASLPPGKKPGWLISDRLKDSWNLTLGKSQRELPKILSDLESIDIFIHDSEHSLTCMMFEFELAWEFLERGGLLLSDDIDCNRAFKLFTERKKTLSGLAGPRHGYMVKK